MTAKQKQRAKAKAADDETTIKAHLETLNGKYVTEIVF